MRIALCNEVLREMDFRDQCAWAAVLGYEGLEIAPFTLAENPHQLGAKARVEFRRMAEDASLKITGLHWLLVSPEGLSVTSRDVHVRQRTLDIMRRLVELCADLGGEILVHGSPKQRHIEEDDDHEEAAKRALEIFCSIAETAQDLGVTYCIEALNHAETNFINTISEAVALVREVGNPAFRTMLDTKAALSTEKEDIPALIDRWLPGGMIAHIHVNDRNLRAPGQGNDRFSPLFRSLLLNRYQGIVSVEPFDYHPDGRTAAARAIGYIQGILEASENWLNSPEPNRRQTGGKET